ncbi:MAG TPA: HAMP domain-containing sensor histidine kinase, partial [Gemmatimonadales bacterium]|nr:HAMP domain-containing sensor histidine kinase [Gemmatimonadales bacterium]
RSRLVRPTRFGRMVEWRSNADPPYTIESVSSFRNGPEPVFRRLGRHLRTERAVDAGGAAMVVRATVSMEPPQPFAVRATLMVLLDLLLAVCLWWLMERLLGLRRSGGEAAVFRRSYRRTITAALLSFFAVPAAFFTIWSVLQLRQDVARDRGLEVARALGELEDDPQLDEIELEDPRPVVLSQVADRVDAELAVYQRGRLVAASNPLLAELGLLAPVIDPALVQAAALDPRELSAPIAGTNVRIGTRAAQIPATTIAAALPGGEAEVAREQVDLALLLLLASLGGSLAAVVVAGAVAGALGRPIEALRRRALAIGRREAPLPLENPPAEFETVFDAISQMEADLGESEARLEEETARTARIVAWGEMARQVAHEIKNPLTPMRLGLQHLRRLGLDGRPDLAEQSAATAERLLGEIDRLDRIARAFARYGAPPSAVSGPLEPLNPLDIAREMGDLYALASSQLKVEVDGQGGMVMARSGELQQVLLNLMDNAGVAGATRVTVSFDGLRLAVADDGSGIAPDQLERIFEPTFSTTTSGTGLGLAIVRRLVESWGATIEATPDREAGAELVITFPGAGSTGPVDPA